VAVSHCLVVVGKWIGHGFRVLSMCDFDFFFPGDLNGLGLVRYGVLRFGWRTIIIK